ncbi:MAG: biopolymer transporter ExbD [Candidatus Omnitrophica bacterium]|nr:biopolymer transporter ExbD [Candidatus Omnitrophota bacterium]
MRIRREADTEKAEMDTSPMVDVVFQLLIFFMVAASFKAEESNLKVFLPAAGAPAVKAAELEEVKIFVASNGAITVNQQAYDSAGSKDLPQLKTMLTNLAGLFKDQAVVIQAHEDSTHGRVVDVLNACAGARIKNISFFAG